MFLSYYYTASAGRVVGGGGVGHIGLAYVLAWSLPLVETQLRMKRRGEEEEGEIESLETR
jgi:hypothetical protein